MIMDPAVMRTLLVVAVGTLAAGICFLLGRSTAHIDIVMLARPYPVAAFKGGHTYAARLRTSPLDVSGGRMQPELLTAARAAANEDGALLLVTANKAAMLHQTPLFMSALHGQPASPPVADNLIIITFDAVAQRLCARQHRASLCVLDSWETSKLGVDPDSLAESLRGNAEWGGPAFRAITWRKVELVHDLLLQGFSVLSCDLDITLFRNPLDPQANPWMRPEVDMIVAQDESVTGMFNCGFFFVRPVVSVLEFFKVWLGAAYDAPVPLDVWEQKVYNHTLSINPTAVRRHSLGQTYFADMCFYHDMRVTLTHNPTAWIDAHGFGDSFDASMDALKAWDTLFGFHTPCCYSGQSAYPEPADQECKFVANGVALLRWQRHKEPWERYIKEQGGLPAGDGSDGTAEQLYMGNPSGTGWRGARDMTLRVSQTAAAVTTQQDVFASPGDINGTASVVQMRPLPSLEDLEALRLNAQQLRDKYALKAQKLREENMRYALALAVSKGKGNGKAHSKRKF